MTWHSLAIARAFNVWRVGQERKGGGTPRRIAWQPWCTAWEVVTGVSASETFHALNASASPAQARRVASSGGRRGM